MALLGKFRLKLNRYTDAEEVLSECLTMRRKQMPDDWRLYNTESMLGGALAGQKRFVEAEPLLISGYEGMKSREGEMPVPAKSNLSEAVQRLVSLYEAKSEAVQLEKWRRVLNRMVK